MKSKSSTLGSGKRFAALKEKVKKEGLSDKAASAVAANAGRKKYGSKKMESLAKKGKKNGKK